MSFMFPSELQMSSNSTLTSSFPKVALLQNSFHTSPSSSSSSSSSSRHFPAQSAADFPQKATWDGNRWIFFVVLLCCSPVVISSAKRLVRLPSCDDLDLSFISPPWQLGSRSDRGAAWPRLLVFFSRLPAAFHFGSCPARLAVLDLRDPQKLLRDSLARVHLASQAVQERLAGEEEEEEEEQEPKDGNDHKEEEEEMFFISYVFGMLVLTMVSTSDDEMLLTGPIGLCFEHRRTVFDVERRR
eukprot:758836-Hanusia_phi.AAC.2